MIKVVLVDNHILVREGIKLLLEQENDIEVIGEATDGEEALEILKKINPDIILLDINMPELNGIEILRKIKAMDKSQKVIMLTLHNEREYVVETINLGANGYILKSKESDSLIRGIRDVNKGGSYVHPSLAESLVKEHKQTGPEAKLSKELEDLKKLTRREKEVLKLISQGMSNRDIAHALFISEKTVKNHVSNIFKKIHVNDRTQAAIFALRNQPDR